MADFNLEPIAIEPPLAEQPAAAPPTPRGEAALAVADIPVKISAVLGKKRMSVGALMALEEGAVIELDRRVGEPIDLFVNDRLVARGELVLVDGVLGVTMTEIVHGGER